MEKKMKTYPYIGQCYSVIALFYAEGKALLVDDALGLDEASAVGDKLNLSDGTNITPEYLANTYGEVVSPEHAEFIIELAKNAGFRFTTGTTNGFTNWFSFDAGDLTFFKHKEYSARTKKQITIPIPPKTDKQEPSEWPQIGVEVCYKESGNSKGVVLAIDEDIAWVKNSHGGYSILEIKSLVKLKTPEEELRDHIVHLIDDSKRIGVNSCVLALHLMSELDIKKKPQ